MNVAVAGIPKTIDNDVDYIDRSFGFESAVEAAQVAIRSAKTEAICNMPNGVGIVKLMGRSAGYIAAHASLSSGDVDLCLLPEVPIVLRGEKGCLPHIMRRVKEQGYAVIVVAEGAGEDVLGTSAEMDASGNKKLPPIGTFMKSQVEEYFKDHDKVATVKYIDPSYTVRSVPANAQDSLCKFLMKMPIIQNKKRRCHNSFFKLLLHYLQIVCSWGRMLSMEQWQDLLGSLLVCATTVWSSFRYLS